MDVNSKNYELTYLLSDSVPEGEALAYVGKISEVVESQNGAIRRVETPKKRRLAYPVRKEQNAYLGWTTFALSPEYLSKVERQLKELPQVLRHLIVEEEVEARRPFLRPLPPRPFVGAPRPAPPAEKKEDEKLDLEALDKKLEEILGK